MKAINLTDGYKLDHRRQYPDNTTLVYSNFTPRGSRIDGINEVVFFGMQYFIKKYMIKKFDEQFFNKPVDEVCDQYQRRINNYLGQNQIGTDHIRALHDLGYLPVEIKAVAEGTRVPIKVPMFTIKNTLPEFFWVTNYLETLVSCCIWLPCNSATIALQYKKLLTRHAEASGNVDFVPFQAHDFSFRGMSSVESALISAAAHLTSFVGTDTVPAIDFLEDYYGANSDEEMVGVSVPATEHSVMSMGSKSGEVDTFKRLITEIYPNGIVSIVSDTWNLWDVLTKFLPFLKDEVMARDGKVVIRPDSGDPVDIICGNSDSMEGSPEERGVIQLLWDVFGGTVNDKGFKELDPHIGAIYGDSITLERADIICKKLQAKGFASTNIVFGVGSFTYQYNTRDTFGFAMKATYGEVDGEGRELFKDPITDDGLKKSAKGLLKVQDLEGVPCLVDQVNWVKENSGLLETVFIDGELTKEFTLKEIREKIAK